VAELRRATTAAAPEALPGALRAALTAGRRRWAILAGRYGQPVPDRLSGDLAAVIDRLAGATG